MPPYAGGPRGGSDDEDAPRDGVGAFLPPLRIARKARDGYEGKIDFKVVGSRAFKDKRGERKQQAAEREG